MLRSTKTYGHDLGLSVVFRQWGAKSHCAKLHGYALAVTLTFGCSFPDENGWVVDFGGLKEIKKYLTDTFDHKLLVATDDPHYARLELLQDWGLADMIPVDQTGCEGFARMIYEYTARWLKGNLATTKRAFLVSVEVREHGANSATYFGPK